MISCKQNFKFNSKKEEHLISANIINGKTPDDHKIYSVWCNYDHYERFGEFNTEVWIKNQEGKLISTLLGHKKNINSAIFSDDGKYIVTACYHGTVRVSSTESGTCIHSFAPGKYYGNSVRSISMSQNILVTGDTEFNATLWDINTGEKINVIQNWCYVGGSVTVSISDDLTKLAIGGTCGEIIIYESSDQFKNYKNIIRNESYHSTFITAIKFSKDSKQIFTASFDKKVQFIDIENDSLIHTFESNCIVKSLALSKNNSYIIYSSHRGNVYVYNIYTFELIFQYKLEDHKDIHCVDISSDGTLIVSGSTEKRIVSHQIIPHKPLLKMPVTGNSGGGSNGGGGSGGDGHCGSIYEDSDDEDEDDDNTYFLMVNEKGDYGCFEFEDYDRYIETWNKYKNIGWINETSPIPKRVPPLVKGIIDHNTGDSGCYGCGGSGRGKTQ